MNDVQDRINQHALTVAMALLMHTRAPSMDEIREAVAKACESVPRNADTKPDSEWVICRVLANCNVTVGVESVLVDSTLHIPWLPTKKASIKWRFWDRYATWLRTKKDGWPEPLVAKLDSVTDKILSLLQDPTRAGAWDTRGMVMGSVQSGKTANYAGLVCKAADAGYKLIIILGGMQKSLRSQTQIRLDEGFFGFNTTRATAYGQGTKRTGVGLVKTPEELRCDALTGSADNGDFSKAAATSINVKPGGGTPVYLVVKKNKSILQNLIVWLSQQAEDDGNGGASLIRDLPFLLIDDEADNGSINTKAIPVDSDGVPLPEYDVTAINGKIRELLGLFEKSAYVGYTATPFANIFIDPEESSEKHGANLFPRNFIISLPVPSNYIGPAKVFGFDGSSDAGIPAEPGLGIVLEVDDASSWLPTPHKNGTRPTGPLPESLNTAILDFILACATRRARGQTRVHNSMLVHVTRYTSTQNSVAEQIGEHLTLLQNRIKYGDGERTPSIIDELRNRWETEFQRKFASIKSVTDDPMITALNWGKIEAEIKDSAALIQVRVINGSAGDALDYHNHPDGLSVIAIGGDKLSRGLTLDGLSVSYFLRTSKMYDTLMQMGRWFGYRPGYVDVCRLFLPGDLREWYRHIALASEELRLELDHMADIHATPMDYGLRVRMHPSGMLITGLNKMRNGTPMRVSFNGTLNETIIFDLTPPRLALNLEASKGLLASLAANGPFSLSTQGSARIWRNQSPDLVVGFLEQYKTHVDAKRVDSAMLAKFIRRRVSQGELTSWTIGIVSNEDKKKEVVLPGFPQGVGLYERKPLEIKLYEGLEPPVLPLTKYTIKRLVSPKHEAADLSKEQYDAAYSASKEAAAKKDKEVPDYALGPDIRNQRGKNNGLLLLYPLDPKYVAGEGKPIFLPIAEEVVFGFAISFPSETANVGDGVDYMVNHVYAATQDFDLE
ncbi:MAG: Z1 domain-containing protein [Verrucomicrobium sp.]|nr:Z1 domain-containing protein [Verrucomicrobium sp.]